MTCNAHAAPTQVQRLVEAVDEDKSGEIGFEEFVSVITRSTGSRNPIKKL